MNPATDYEYDTFEQLSAALGPELMVYWDRDGVHIDVENSGRVVHRLPDGSLREVEKSRPWLLRRRTSHITVFWHGAFVAAYVCGTWFPRISTYEDVQTRVWSRYRISV